MDEVLAVGDSNFQSKCLREFARYKEMGKTVILVTHDIATVQRYCDRAMLLRSGEVVKVGSAEEVGNEYIYQNMSDEEKRIVDEQKRERVKAEKASESLKGDALAEEKKRIEDEKNKQDEERKNKVAEITGVEFLDKDGKVKNVFETGEDMSVRVYFKRRDEKAGKLNFGIAMHNQEDDYIFGINTLIDKIDTGKYIDLGYFQADYRNIPIKTDSYYVKTGIFGESDREFHDLLDRSDMFSVISKNHNQGLVELDYTWK